jgi:LEA14-like dessication related protein
LIPLIALAGCSSIERASLHVSIADISVADASVSGDEATITLDVANEELFPAVVESDIHKIYVDGLFIGEATGDESYALPTLGVARRVLKVRITDPAAAAKLKAAIRAGGGDYKVESRLSTRAGDDRTIFVNTSAGRFKTGGG